MQAYVRDLESAIRAGDVARAMRIGGEAAAKGFENAQILVLAAYDEMQRGASERGLVYAQRAQELAPDNVDVLTVLGIVLAQLDRRQDALQAYDAALRLAPDAANVHFNRACLLKELKEFDQAQAAFERTIALKPNHVDALTWLANMAATQGDAKSARDYAVRALAHDPRKPAAILAMAMADLEEKDYAAALSCLKPLVQDTSLDLINRSIALGLIGDANDGLGNTSEAFGAHQAGKAAVRAHYLPRYQALGAEPAIARLDRLIAGFEGTSSDLWRPQSTPRAATNRTHVFMVGFPRSGTTLLERVLASHPAIETMEERDCLVEGAADFPPDSLGKLAQLGDGQLEPYRTAYWRRVAEAGYEAARPVFVDKMPLNTILLPLIARLFPAAKVIFSLRDPRDVVLSCFRRRFGMTPQMFEFTTLEGTARYYSAIMRFAELCRARLSLELLDSRYEDLVSGFDAEAGRLCAFLGLSFTETLRDFAANTRDRNINTPSAPQVARGLFQHGVGQWRAYRKELASVMPVLAPWVARFGYDAD